MCLLSFNMCSLNEDLVKTIVLKAKIPVILKQFLGSHDLCQWSLEKWCSVFEDKAIPFRCMCKKIVSNEPSWERKCFVKNMTFKQFVEQTPNSLEWMYFDYKYLHQWFKSDSELYKKDLWKQFGFLEKGPSDSTLWVGSEGAHTPAHQDTYGTNIVVQLYGKKRWILFPPEATGLKPTRVPYEESSIYSDLNFFCPAHLDAHKGLSGGRSIELSAGDALIVPRNWWHYVQNTAPLSISMNVWIPHEKDDATRVSEALIRILIAQICKDLPENKTKLIVNPNESDLSDTPLAVLFLQLETVTKAYLDTRRKQRRIKRQKTAESSTSNEEPEIDVKDILKKINTIEEVPQISKDELINLIKSNLDKYTNKSSLDAVDLDGGSESLCLTKALINAFSENNVIELVKQNLLATLDRC